MSTCIRQPRRVGNAPITLLPRPKGASRDPHSTVPLVTCGPSLVAAANQARLSATKQVPNRAVSAITKVDPRAVVRLPAGE